MTDQEYCARLAAWGFSQSAFARRLIALGDPRSFPTVLRSVSNQATGAVGVSAEMTVILTLMERYPAIRGVPEVRAAGRPRKAAAAP